MVRLCTVDQPDPGWFLTPSESECPRQEDDLSLTVSASVGSNVVILALAIDHGPQQESRYFELRRKGKSLPTRVSKFVRAASSEWLAVLRVCRWRGRQDDNGGA